MKSYKIVLVGQPNAGKSTLFNVLSDIKAAASNFAGTSVKITQSAIQLEGRVFQLLDLPGHLFPERRRMTPKGSPRNTC